MERHVARRHFFLALALGLALVAGSLIGVRASTPDLALRAAPTINAPSSAPAALRAAPTIKTSV
jgi:hypothetical protein